MFRAPFPILHVRDVERSARFYEDCFDYTERYRYPAEGEPSLVVILLDDRAIGLAPRAGDGGTAALELCFYTEDVDAAAARLREAGVPELRPPETLPWGERRCTFADPDGNPLQICAALF